MKLTAPIQKLAAEIKATYALLIGHEATAVNTALYLGALLNELKIGVGHGPFIEARRDIIPGLSDDRAERYMKAAANVLKQVDLPATDIPVSRLLSAPAAELSPEAREAQQLLFDFTKDKTIKECLAAIVVDGDEPHRITRAANGKKHGGSKGEDRKDYPKFIRVHLSDVATHLKSWKSFTPAQAEEVTQHFGTLFAKLPDALLSEIKRLITDEIKSR